MVRGVALIIVHRSSRSASFSLTVHRQWGEVFLTQDIDCLSPRMGLRHKKRESRVHRRRPRDIYAKRVEAEKRMFLARAVALLLFRVI